MPLPPYQYRPATPPSADLPGLIAGSGHGRNMSASSFGSANSSPDSLDYHVATPYDRSPVRQAGPTLLPRIRTQDHLFEPPATSAKSHRRALSNNFNPPAQARPRPSAYRSTTSPPECESLVSPQSATTTYSGLSFGSGFDSTINSAVNSPVTFTPYQRTICHSRSSSAPGIDDVTLGRYGYPYRQPPAYVTCGDAVWAPAVASSTFVVSPPALSRQGRSQVLIDDQLGFDPNEPVSSVIDYFNCPNPAVDIVRHVSQGSGLNSRSHAWWDIRNLRSWEDFSLETIMETPDFPNLLKVSVPARNLPVPYIAPNRLRPETESGLVEIIRDFYMTKVNAALTTTQGSRHVSMRLGREREGATFVANYEDDVQRTITGNGQGRVVGIVRSYERWNTGLRTEATHKKVEYLEGLAHLHWLMREHQCRYGFIMTETELVCARAGTDETPYFGFLELAPTIETRTQGGLTACVALWYLHMLAKDEPLPGQCGWKLSIGAPAALTRKRVMKEKDSWIPQPGVKEKRMAKVKRGWIMPEDPWSRKREVGKVWLK